MNRELKINPSKERKLNYVISFVVVDILYAIMVKYKWCDRNLGISLIIFFAALTVFFLYSAYFPKPKFILNEEGIKHTGLKGSGLIEWKKISEIYICIIPKKDNKLYFLGIKYKESEEDVKKVKFKGKVNEKVGDVTIPLKELEFQPYDIYTKILKFYNKK